MPTTPLDKDETAALLTIRAANEEGRGIKPKLQDEARRVTVLRLRERGLLEASDDGYWITEKGREALSEAE